MTQREGFVNPDIRAPAEKAPIVSLEKTMPVSRDTLTLQKVYAQHRDI